MTGQSGGCRLAAGFGVTRPAWTARRLRPRQTLRWRVPAWMAGCSFWKFIRTRSGNCGDPTFWGQTMAMADWSSMVLYRLPRKASRSKVPPSSTSLCLFSTGSIWRSPRTFSSAPLAAAAFAIVSSDFRPLACNYADVFALSSTLRLVGVSALFFTIEHRCSNLPRPTCIHPTGTEARCTCGSGLRSLSPEAR